MEFCIQPANRTRSLASEVELTPVHEIKRDTHGLRIKGDSLTNNMFCTYLPVSIVDDAIMRMCPDDKVGP